MIHMPITWSCFYLPSEHKSLGHPPVSSPEAGGDEVGHPTAFQEGLGLHPGVVGLDKLPHLL